MNHDQTAPGSIVFAIYAIKVHKQMREKMTIKVYPDQTAAVLFPFMLKVVR